MFALCFTETAEVIRGTESIVGRPAIHDEFLARRQRRTEAGQQPRHVITNVLIEHESESSARVRSYYTLAVSDSDGCTVSTAGWYLDDFTLDGDVWRIARREMHSDQQ